MVMLKLFTLAYLLIVCGFLLPYLNYGKILLILPDLKLKKIKDHLSMFTFLASQKILEIIFILEKQGHQSLITSSTCDILISHQFVKVLTNGSHRRKLKKSCYSNGITLLK